MSASPRQHYEAKSFMTAGININAYALAFAQAAINLKHRCRKPDWQRSYLPLPHGVLLDSHCFPYASLALTDTLSLSEELILLLFRM